MKFTIGSYTLEVRKATPRLDWARGVLAEVEADVGRWAPTVPRDTHRI